MVKKIEIFTSPWCHNCRLVKQVFERKGLAYTELDIINSSKNREELFSRSAEKFGWPSPSEVNVPLIYVDNICFGDADDLYQSIEDETFSETFT